MKMVHDSSERLASVVAVDGRAVPRGIAEVFARVRDVAEQVESGETGIDLQHYTDLTEWVMHLLLVGIMHAVPEAKTEDAIKVAQFVARRLYLPGTKSLWRVAANWIERHGIVQSSRRVMQELQRTAVTPEKR